MLFLPFSQLFGQSNKYAVLINSAYDKELNRASFNNEIARVYEYLISDLNYSETNIFIYSGDGADSGDDYSNGFYTYYNTDPDLDGDGDDDITGPSYYDTITSKFSDLNFLNNDDFLFVYLTGPLKEVWTGGWHEYDYYPGIAFWNSDLQTNYSLASPLNSLSPDNLLFIDARNSDGIYMNYYVGDNRYIIKSMTYTEGTSGIPYSSYFGRYFLDALIGEDFDENLVNADYDSSGKTTIREARQYARNQVSPDYSDFYWYDELIASNISLNGYEGCQSIFTMRPGIVSGIENFVKCNVIINGLVVINGGHLNIAADGNVTIERDFSVELGGTLEIQ